MKIVLAHNYYQLRGGEDAVFEAEAALLEAHGHTVIRHVVHNQSIRSTLEKAKAFGGIVWSRPSAAEIGKILDFERPDVLHVHNFFPLLTPAVHAEAARRGVATVQTLHNFRIACAGGTLNRNGVDCEACVGRLPIPAIVHRCYRGSLGGSVAVAGMIAAHRRMGTWHRSVDRFIALTAFQRDKAVAMGLPAERIAIKPNFVADPGPSGESRNGALFVGRLAPGKGSLELVRAWRDSDMPLTLAGTGPLEAEIRHEAAPAVTIKGHLDRTQLADQYRRARVLVMPSTAFEGMPMSLLEAMAAGLPAITFRHSGFPEMVEHGVTGLLAPPGDFAALMAHVRWAAAHPQAMDAMGRAARRRYEQRYTPRVAYGGLLSIYCEAIASAAVRRGSRLKEISRLPAVKPSTPPVR